MTLIDFTTLKAAQDAHMLDECNLIRYTITYNSYGEEIKTSVITSGVVCGFAFARTYDKDTGSWLSTGTDGTLRLPVTTILDDVTDIQITNRSTISGYWMIEGEPIRGNTCIVLNIKGYDV